MSALETTADAGAGYQDGEVNDEDYIEELHEELQAQMDAREAAENRVAELEREVNHLLKEVEIGGVERIEGL